MVLDSAGKKLTLSFTARVCRWARSPHVRPRYNPPDPRWTGFMHTLPCWQLQCSPLCVYDQAQLTRQKGHLYTLQQEHHICVAAWVTRHDFVTNLLSESLTECLEHILQTTLNTPFQHSQTGTIIIHLRLWLLTRASLVLKVFHITILINAHL